MNVAIFRDCLLTQVHERELFLAKKTETISATQIRGKCSVSLLHKVSRTRDIVQF
jgi:hypothetical protein